MGNHIRPYQFLFTGALFSLVLVSWTPALQATDYYADLTITVDTSGFVSIMGVTDYPNLIVQNTEQYTSKQQRYWLLNITKQETFSEYVYELILPKGASISYIRSSGSLRILEKQGSLAIRGFGENESLVILLQYQLEKPAESILQENMVYLILLPAILLVTLLIIFLYFKENRAKKQPLPVDSKEPPADLKGLNHRQKQIIQLLRVRQNPLTQTEIQKELQIPKASVSRNIHGLERKGLIEKEQIGMSNLIRLKKY